MASAAVLLAPGFEEIEAVTVIDVLRRAGVHVIVAGLGEGPVAGSHEITLVAETTVDRVRAASIDMVVLPGGLPGTYNLRDDPRVIELLRETARAGKHTSAICAAPVVLQAAGLLEGKAVTSHPAIRDELAGLDYREDRVVKDGRVVTSRGPGTAIEFSLELVRILVGPDKARELAAAMLAG